jgi:uncharacterized protein DUF4149
MRRLEPEVIQFAVIAIWLGAAAFFSIAVAPALFAVLPSRSLAGEVVGRLLPGIFYSGIIVGAVVAWTQFRAQSAWSWRGRESAGAVMIAACGIAQLIVAPRIDRLRAEIGGPLEILPADDARRVAFGRLHGASVAWLGLAMIAAIIVLVIVARSLNVSDRRFHTL